MSSTRYQRDRSDVFDGAERHLSNPKLVGLNVSLRYIGAVAPERTEQQSKDSLWFFNYARIVQQPAAQLCRDIGMSTIEVRDALTDPDASPETLAKFGEIVADLRVKFIAGLKPLYETAVCEAVRSGVRKGKRGGVFSTIIGPYRVGKTDPLRDEFFRHHMDTAVFADLPPGDDMLGFMSALGESMGIGRGAGRKVTEYKGQILEIVKTGIVKRIFFDEWQYVFPKNPNVFPEKVSFLRHCIDKARFFRAGRGGNECLSVIGCATPQFRHQLNLMLEGQWAAGQFEGRQIITYTPDILTRDEIEGIAWHMAPDFSADVIEILCDVTEANPGLLGFLEQAVSETRFRVQEENKKLTTELVGQVAKEMIRDTEVERKAKEAAAKALKLVA